MSNAFQEWVSGFIGDFKQKLVQCLEQTTKTLAALINETHLAEVKGRGDVKGVATFLNWLVEFTPSLESGLEFSRNEEGKTQKQQSGQSIKTRERKAASLAAPSLQPAKKARSPFETQEPALAPLPSQPAEVATKIKKEKAKRQHSPPPQAAHKLPKISAPTPSTTVQRSKIPKKGGTKAN